MENPVEIKNLSNKQAIIKTLYFEGPLSNTEIGHKLKLSMPKIISLLEELRSCGQITEMGQGASSGGRRPILIGLSSETFYLFGVSIGFEKTHILLLNSQNQQIDSRIYADTTVFSGTEVFSQIKQVFEEMLEENHIPREKLFAVGMEMPGLINSQKKVNKSYFEGFDFSKLDSFFGFPVYLENDVKVRMFWEYRFGKAKGLKNALLVHSDHGIGLGMLMKGKLYTGKNGYAGEFGHLPICPDGKLCVCGKKGCLETVASTMAITEIAKQGIEGGVSSMILNLAGGDASKITIDLVIQAALSGDHFAISVLSDASHWLGLGIAYLVQLFNPEMIILSGRITQAGSMILPPIQQSINSYANPAIAADTEIVISQQDQECATIGAAALAFYKLFIP